MKTIVCPISSERIPEHVSRLTALLVVLILLAYLISGNLVFPVVLVFDFLNRGFLGGKYSLLAFASKIIGNSLSLKSKLVDKAPKVFAARLGLIFAVTLTITSLLHFKGAALAIIVMFGACALLEFAISFCVGCLLYTIISRTFQPN